MSVRKTLFGRLFGGKDKTMAEATPTPTPTIDPKVISDAISAALATALPAAIGEAVKPISEAVAKLQPATPPPAAGDKAKPLTAEDVTRLVSDSLKTFQQQTQQSAARQQYQGDKLKDLPPIYRDRLGSDPAKWATEEQAIRDQFKADRVALGVKVEDLGGGNPGGAAPTKQADLSKLSPTAALAQVMKEERAAGPTTTTTTAPAAK